MHSTKCEASNFQGVIIEGVGAMSNKFTDEETKVLSDCQQNQRYLMVLSVPGTGVP